ncbi:hypothetical protein BFJ68_g15947 [Fusarium oxysporum]|jgi:hypothetical protein|uniref:Uncharacterized protein n=1 Tax=Fusarium oxysporum TaxID=5507 RepID=A0A420PID9_FUSOX|nr:hypothetical protein LZL87_013447 [Fusarium oxysporum]RKK92296.1 hypothetical protein BFJ68_g15947 [Fusarium oxysporum]
MKIAAIVATFMLAMEPVAARYCSQGWIECNCKPPSTPSYTITNRSKTTGGSVIPAALAFSTAVGVQTSMVEWEHYLGRSASVILVLEEVALILVALGLVTMLQIVATLVTVEVLNEL